ncbi:MAG: hypothetical protein WAT70_05875 [Rhizobiaceae bacterium]
MRRLLAALCLILPTPAFAEGLIDGVYMQSEELCVRARAEGLETVAGDGNLVLSPGRIESVEYHCQFVDVKSAGDHGEIATAWCEEPGFAFPDLLSITRRTENTLEIASVRDQPELPSGNSGTWTKCEGVTRP